MAMSIMNDSSTAMTLGELNKNINKLGKTLAKLSKGQRIVSAADDSASFAISEKMREQIRSLEQDIQNVQNGSSILKTAHGGIENIVDELRCLKELAIDAANDSNTDEDRAIMQKEFDQRRATIDEIANWTKYNGKALLDGTYARDWKYRSYVVNELVVNNSTGSVSSKGDDGPVKLNGVYNLVNNFSASHNAKSSTASSAGAPEVPENVDKTFEYKSYSAWSYSKAKGISGQTSQNNQFAVVMDFSAATILGKLPSVLNNQGFCITCNGCDQYINIKFDSSISASESSYNSEFGDLTKHDVTPRQFIIGVKDVKNISQLPKAIFDGMSVAEVDRGTLDENTEDNILVDSAHQVRLAKDPSNSNRYIFLKNSGSPALQFINRLVESESDDGDDDSEPEPDPEEPTEPQTVDYIYNDGNPLWVQHGTHANQRINVYINDMKTSAMEAKLFDIYGDFVRAEDRGRFEALSNDPEKQSAFFGILKEADRKTLDQASVRTQYDANVAICIVGGIIDYALDEATMMGAYLQRLEYTEANVTTQDENTQGAESTIRDADMAKEMSEYTKNNVLSQAAQLMLAQANQNMSGVLSLLR